VVLAVADRKMGMHPDINSFWTVGREHEHLWRYLVVPVGNRANINRTQEAIDTYTHPGRAWDPEDAYTHFSGLFQYNYARRLGNRSYVWAEGHAWGAARWVSGGSCSDGDVLVTFDPYEAQPNYWDEFADKGPRVQIAVPRHVLDAWTQVPGDVVIPGTWDIAHRFPYKRVALPLGEVEPYVRVDT
jgi:hypothetical protein